MSVENAYVASSTPVTTIPLFKCTQAPKPKPCHFPTPRQRPLLLHVRPPPCTLLHVRPPPHALHVRLHTDTSLLLHADASLLYTGTSLLLHAATVRTTLLLRRWSMPPRPLPPIAVRQTLSLSLFLSLRDYAWKFINLSFVSMPMMLRSLLSLVICIEVYKSLGS
jgi:hypothetical protein